jgi:hypothetical protein
MADKASYRSGGKNRRVTHRAAASLYIFGKLPKNRRLGKLIRTKSRLFGNFERPAW